MMVNVNTFLSEYVEYVKCLGVLLPKINLVDEVEQLPDVYLLLEFLNVVKEIQRRKIVINQYTSIQEDISADLQNILPEFELNKLKFHYLNFADYQINSLMFCKDIDEMFGNFDFELVLFGSALIDLEYVIRKVSKWSTGSDEYNKSQLIYFAGSVSNLMPERRLLMDFISSLDSKSNLDVKEVEKRLVTFKDNQFKNAVKKVAVEHGVPNSKLLLFTRSIVDTLSIDADMLTDIFAESCDSWRARMEKERGLVKALVPLIHSQCNAKSVKGLTSWFT